MRETKSKAFSARGYVGMALRRKRRREQQGGCNEKEKDQDKKKRF